MTTPPLKVTPAEARMKTIQMMVSTQMEVWMDNDYELDDVACPKCGHSPTHSRRCTQLGCNDGYIDMHEHDDPLWYDEGEEEKCDECNGTGVEKWCPKCGFDLQRNE